LLAGGESKSAGNVPVRFFIGPPPRKLEHFSTMMLGMLWPWLTFAGVLIFTLALLCATLVVLMASTLLRPERMGDARATMVLKRLSPNDLGLDYEPLFFDVRDERTGKNLRLAAWWIPCESTSRTIVLIHGYADAKVGGIAWAPILRSLGWNILAIDLRAHGESQGLHSTAGFYERHDVGQIINQFRALQPQKTQALAIFGVSLGAAVACAVSAMRDDIAAVILESPYGDYRRAIAAHGRMRGLPEGFMRATAIRLAEWMSASDFRAVRPEDQVKRVPCPVMLIHAGNDPFVPDDDAQIMKQAFLSRNNPLDVHWSVDEAGHVLGVAAGPQEYRQRLGDFLEASTGSTWHGRPAREESVNTGEAPVPH
jgi:pimeloyl-ACP methyl ester carboxylesterase